MKVRTFPVVSLVLTLLTALPLSAGQPERCGTKQPGDEEIAQIEQGIAKGKKGKTSAVVDVWVHVISQGAGFANVVEFTTYLVHSQDIAKFMAFRLREFPRIFPSGAYPPNTLLIVDRLVQEPFLIEVHTVAAL